MTIATGNTPLVEFFCHGLPAPKGSMRLRNRYTGAMEHDNERTKPWQASVAWAANEAMRGRPPVGGALRVWLVFYLQRPRSHYTRAGALKANAPAFSAVRPDLDKLQRSALDAMTGVVWIDDGQVSVVIAEKRYANGSPGLQVAVSEIAAKEGGRQ